MLKGQAVTVLGAGVAGLTLARALALRGAWVTVLEQAPGIGEVGAGLQISPNGGRVLQALGLGGGLEAASQRSGAVVLIDGKTGSQVLRMRLDRAAGQAGRAGQAGSAGDGFRLIHRADLIALLAEGARAAGAEIRTGTRVEAVGLGDHPPRLTLASGETVEAALLIGADGILSRVRAALNGVVAPFFTHQVAWRATLPAAPGIAPEARVYLGPGRHVVTYPLRGGTLRNIVAVEERRAWVEESWSLTDDPLALRIAFRDFVPEVRGWFEQIERPNLWGLFRHPVAARWHGHGAAILGDAAHPTLPFLAQGANMALEDAWVLAAALDARPAAEALAAYQAARAGRVARIVAAANANARNYHLSGLRRDIAHAGLRLAGRFAPTTLTGRFAWLYGHDVTAG